MSCIFPWPLMRGRRRALRRGRLPRLFWFVGAEVRPVLGDSDDGREAVGRSVTTGTRLARGSKSMLQQSKKRPQLKRAVSVSIRDSTAAAADVGDGCDVWLFGQLHQWETQREATGQDRLHAAMIEAALSCRTWGSRVRALGWVSLNSWTAWTGTARANTT